MAIQSDVRAQVDGDARRRIAVVDAIGVPEAFLGLKVGDETAVEQVVAGPAPQEVVAEQAEERVVAGTAEERVVEIRADERLTRNRHDIEVAARDQRFGVGHVLGGCRDVHIASAQEHVAAQPGANLAADRGARQHRAHRRGKGSGYAARVRNRMARRVRVDNGGTVPAAP